MTRYRLTLFGKPRGKWHDTRAEAIEHAIAQKLADRDRENTKRVWWTVGADIETEG